MVKGHRTYLIGFNYHWVCQLMNEYISALKRQGFMRLAQDSADQTSALTAVPVQGLDQ